MAPPDSNFASLKDQARKAAKARREAAHDPAAGVELIRHFPAARFRGQGIGAYWTLPGEMDVRPLMGALVGAGHRLSLPCIKRRAEPLIFRAWRPGDELALRRYSLREPYQNQPEIRPTLILVPLLAFTQTGKRLGYGGGFYDRTLAKLRAQSDVFACGVGYAAQEASDLPVDAYDQPLDGILTEQYFKDFTCA